MSFDSTKARLLCDPSGLPTADTLPLLMATRSTLEAALDEVDRLISDGPTWLGCAICVLHECVDLTDPNDPVGVALTRAGLERAPYRARMAYEEMEAERDRLAAELARLHAFEQRHGITLVEIEDPDMQWCNGKAIDALRNSVAELEKERDALAAENARLADIIAHDGEQIVEWKRSHSELCTEVQALRHGVAQKQTEALDALHAAWAERDAARAELADSRLLVEHLKAKHDRMQPVWEEAIVWRNDKYPQARSWKAEEIDAELVSAVDAAIAGSESKDPA